MRFDLSFSPAEFVFFTLNICSDPEAEVYCTVQREPAHTGVD